MIINFNARRQKPPFLPSNTLFDSNLLKVDFDLRFIYLHIIANLVEILFLILMLSEISNT